jgi:hypothetical protein
MSGKGRTAVIDRDAYQEKIINWAQKNQFTKTYKDPTDVYQKQIQQQYTIYLDMRCGFSWMRSHWIIYCQRCLYTQAQKYKQLVMK